MTLRQFNPSVPMMRSNEALREFGLSGGPVFWYKTEREIIKFSSRVRTGSYYREPESKKTRRRQHSNVTTTNGGVIRAEGIRRKHFGGGSYV